jgi:hypothetical protein
MLVGVEYGKIAQFAKKPEQRQKKRFAIALEYTTQAGLFLRSTGEFLLVQHQPPKPNLAKRGKVTCSLLEGVGAYSTACAATRLVHMHTTSFL